MRVRRLAELRSAEGYLAEAVPDGQDMLLLEHHCPICDAASACQGLCRAELDLFRQTLGDDVEVTRAQHLLSGDLRCAYRVSPRLHPWSERRQDSRGHAGLGVEPCSRWRRRGSRTLDQCASGTTAVLDAVLSDRPAWRRTSPTSSGRPGQRSIRSFSSSASADRDAAGLRRRGPVRAEAITRGLDEATVADLPSWPTSPRFGARAGSRSASSS